MVDTLAIGIYLLPLCALSHHTFRLNIPTASHIVQLSLCISIDASGFGAPPLNNGTPLKAKTPTVYAQYMSSCNWPTLFINRPRTMFLANISRKKPLDFAGNLRYGRK